MAKSEKPDRAALRRAAIEYFGGREHPFTLTELREWTGYSRWTIRRLRDRGRLPSLGEGKNARFLVEDVYLFLKENTF